MSTKVGREEAHNLSSEESGLLVKFGVWGGAERNARKSSSNVCRITDDERQRSILDEIAGGVGLRSEAEKTEGDGGNKSLKPSRCSEESDGIYIRISAYKN